MEPTQTPFFKSDEIDLLIKALVKFHAKLPKVVKDEVNSFYKNSYAPLSTILDTIDPVLNEHGLTVIQLPTGSGSLTTVLAHESGQYIGSTSRMESKEATPQAVGSAITYQRRYALGAVLSLNIDEDDDGHSGSLGPAKTPAAVRSEARQAASRPPVQTTIPSELEFTVTGSEPGVSKGSQKPFLKLATDLGPIYYFGNQVIPDGSVCVAEVRDDGKFKSINSSLTIIGNRNE